MNILIEEKYDEQVFYQYALVKEIVLPFLSKLKTSLHSNSGENKHVKSSFISFIWFIHMGGIPKCKISEGCY